MCNLSKIAKQETGVVHERGSMHDMRSKDPTEETECEATTGKSQSKAWANEVLINGVSEGIAERNSNRTGEDSGE